jgi:hypothetical protein
MTTATVAENSPWNTDMKWPAMRIIQKLAFLGKLVIAVLTFGFAFPNILN